MSYNIDKLSFTIWGNGHDETRSDSGDGESTGVDEYTFPYGVNYACFDSSGTYVWLTQNGSYDGLIKCDMATMTDQHQSAISGYSSLALFHPSNVANDYGIVTQVGAGNRRWWVIDLNDDTVVASGNNVTNMDMFGGYECDCILVSNKIYLLQVESGYLATFDLSNGTASVASLAYCGNYSDCFANDSSIFVSNEVSTGRYRLSLVEFDDTRTWNDVQIATDVVGFAMGGNGKLYMPTNDSGWKMGEYSATNPDIATPSPIKTFGSFPSKPSLDLGYQPRGTWRAYNHGRTRMAFTTNVGSYVADASGNSMEKLFEGDNVKVHALNNKYCIATAFNDAKKLYLIKYR